MVANIKEILLKSIGAKEQVANDPALLQRIQDVTVACITCFRGDGKILLCGNGGSAADAQHLAAEFSGRFYHDRDPLFAEALHVNTSYVTAVGNDYGYDQIYSRIVRAKGRTGDVLIGLSTSGNSANVVKAMEQARSQGMITVAMTGATGGVMRDHADHLINVPSTDTPRIQECHITIGHIICELVEQDLF